MNINKISGSYENSTPNLTSDAAIVSNENPEAQSTQKKKERKRRRTIDSRDDFPDPKRRYDTRYSRTLNATPPTNNIPQVLVPFNFDQSNEFVPITGRFFFMIQKNR